MASEPVSEIDIFIGIGSNIDPEVNVRRAIERLRSVGRLIAVSTLYRTPAIGGHGPDFINGAAHLRVRLDRAGVLEALAAIENELGRVRGIDRFAPRTIDLDLLAQHPARDTDLPDVHPDVLDRAFVAGPLAELAPDLPTGEGTTAAGISAGLEEPIGESLPDLTRELQALAEG